MDAQRQAARRGGEPRHSCCTTAPQLRYGLLASSQRCCVWPGPGSGSPIRFGPGSVDPTSQLSAGLAAHLQMSGSLEYGERLSQNAWVTCISSRQPGRPHRRGAAHACTAPPWPSHPAGVARQPPSPPSPLQPTGSAARRPPPVACRAAGGGGGNAPCDQAAGLMRIARGPLLAEVRFLRKSAAWVGQTGAQAPHLQQLAAIVPWQRRLARRAPEQEAAALEAVASGAPPAADHLRVGLAGRKGGTRSAAGDALMSFKGRHGAIASGV